MYIESHLKINEDYREDYVCNAETYAKSATFIQKLPTYLPTVPIRQLHITRWLCPFQLR